MITPLRIGPLESELLADEIGGPGAAMSCSRSRGELVMGSLQFRPRFAGALVRGGARGELGPRFVPAPVNRSLEKDQRPPELPGS